ncbi:MAG TPA: translation initiation factor [Mariprofundaceae bacterium]|nr:translation initiation factor [Mariprofundaceae bacterium]
MSQDRKLVYSTEHGSLEKPMPGKGKFGKKPAAIKAQPSIKNPAKQGVRIRRESKGRGGKQVCIISGLSLGEKELKALLKTLKGHLGTGGALKGGELEIQGDHREKILGLLEREGFKAKLAGG